MCPPSLPRAARSVRARPSRPAPGRRGAGRAGQRAGAARLAGARGRSLGVREGAAPAAGVGYTRCRGVPPRLEGSGLIGCRRPRTRRELCQCLPEAEGLPAPCAPRFGESPFSPVPLPARLAAASLSSAPRLLLEACNRQQAVRTFLWRTRRSGGPGPTCKCRRGGCVRLSGGVVPGSSRIALFAYAFGGGGGVPVAPASQALPTDGNPRGVPEAGSQHLRRGWGAPSTAAPSPNRECEGLAHTVPPPPELLGAGRAGVSGGLQSTG